MRVLLSIVLGAVGTYAVLFGIDVLTVPPTTAAETALGHAYLKANDLPTPPIAFYEDGCTAWPDQLPGHDFYEACLRHDIAYWAGGDLDRKAAADRTFKEDIAQTGPLGPLFATIMYSGVRHFGNNLVSHWLGSEWGYGWSE